LGISLRREDTLIITIIIYLTLCLASPCRAEASKGEGGCAPFLRLIPYALGPAPFYICSQVTLRTS
jgi:hypothetical protein